MNVAPDRMGFIEKGQPFDLFELCEIVSWIDARERPGRTVLFATICRSFGAGRVKRSVTAKVAFDCEQVVGLFNRRGQRVGFEAEPSAQSSADASVNRRRGGIT